MIKYVWLDVETGEFTNSWNQDAQDKVDAHIQSQNPKNFKLLKYECLNDETFEFNINHELSDFS